MIPNDICRCHDQECSQRMKCRRFLDRNTGDEHTAHTETMRDQWGCAYFLKADNDNIQKSRLLETK